MFETGYVFMRDIEALGISIDEAMRIHTLVEVQGVQGGFRAFYKRTSDPIFGDREVSLSINLYLAYYMGTRFQYGYLKGFVL